MCNIFNNISSKIDQPPVDTSCQDLSGGGLGSFITILVCCEIHFLCLFLARVANYKCSNIVSIFRAVPAVWRHRAKLVISL